MKRFAMTAMVALVLAGCQQRAPENALDEGTLVEENIVAPIENVMVAPSVQATNVVEPVAPPPVFTQDEQTRDDADATGMTARLPDETAPGQGGNETRPAE